MSDSTVGARAPSRKEKIAVCLVERNPLAAHWLRFVLGIGQEFEVLSEDSTLNTPRACEIPTPIFVIDLETLPDALATYLVVVRSRFPDAQILLVGGELPPNELRPLHFLGVNGFVPYRDVKNWLGLALEVVSRGDAWFTPQQLDEFAAHSNSLRSEGQSTGQRPELFTPRERLVVGLLNRRLGNKEIASALCISDRTVRFHLANIFRKLGVHDCYSVAEMTRSVGASQSSPKKQNVMSWSWKRS